MGSKYIRFIDLGEVCAAMPTFHANGGVRAERLQSVPQKMAGIVVESFHAFINHPDLRLFGDVPEKVSSKEMATLLDEVLATVWESKPNVGHRQLSRDKKGLPQRPGRIAYRRLFVGRVCTEGPALDALLIYQLDGLCGAQQAGDLDEVLALIPDMLAIQRDIGEREGRAFSSDMLDISSSYEARQRAELRHKPANQQKTALLAEWDATASEYESRADFTRIVSQREGMKYRTLYEWIARHDSAKT